MENFIHISSSLIGHGHCILIVYEFSILCYTVFHTFSSALPLYLVTLKRYIVSHNFVSKSHKGSYKICIFGAEIVDTSTDVWKQRAKCVWKLYVTVSYPLNICCDLLSLMSIHNIVCIEK